MKYVEEYSLEELCESSYKYSNGAWRGYSVVGCYPLYYIARDNSILCLECTECFNEELVVGLGVNYEDPFLTCECGNRIESAYAEEEYEAWLNAQEQKSLANRGAY